MTTKIPTVDEILEYGKAEYQKIYKSEPKIICCAPGRVNLIGEHIDYNDGFVLPMALPMVTIVLGNKNDTPSTIDATTCCPDSDQPNRVQFDMKNLKTSTNPKWANYLKGVIHSYDHTVCGFNAVIVSNVPVGAGLSSSAALEVSTLTFLQELSDDKHVKSASEKALICQKAEHEFVGMPCGIMDQLISVAGKKSHALLIDCRSLETFQIPFEDNNLAVLICNSGVRHELSSSEYPTRRKQCTEALKLMGIQSYRDATEDHLATLKDANEILVRRARHVITEIKRTREAAEALKKHDFMKMGKLMTQSHISLRDDFEVSCKELDILVDAAIVCDGVLGSRMTGGGFGGCTVTLLRNDCIGNVIKEMQAAFMMKCNRKGDMYVCKPSDGARILFNHK